MTKLEITEEDYSDPSSVILTLETGDTIEVDIQQLIMSTIEKLPKDSTWVDEVSDLIHLGF